VPTIAPLGRPASLPTPAAAAATPPPASSSPGVSVCGLGLAPLLLLGGLGVQTRRTKRRRSRP